MDNEIKYYFWEGDYISNECCRRTANGIWGCHKSSSVVEAYEALVGEKEEKYGESFTLKAFNNVT